MAKPHVVDVLARICRQFDVIAVQEIRSRDQDIVPRLIEAINAPGRRYDYVIGPRLPQDSESAGFAEQYAFIFDLETIEVDRQQLYTVNDPEDLLAREPFVGWFRVRGPPAQEAFTFTLVNVHTDPDHADFEVGHLARVHQAVSQDGRGEDDVLILGDFNADPEHMRELTGVSGLDWAISGEMTSNTRGTALYDNIGFQARATTEFTGHSGAFDFLREYNLTLDEALEVSDHLPVWAEFSAYEGGKRGAVAQRDTPTIR
jgi:hypothetical protein